MTSAERVVQSDVFHIGFNTITTTAMEPFSRWKQKMVPPGPWTKSGLGCPRLPRFKEVSGPVLDELAGELGFIPWQRALPPTAPPLMWAGVPAWKGARGPWRRPRAGLHSTFAVLRGLSVVLDYQSETIPRGNPSLPGLVVSGLCGHREGDFEVQPFLSRDRGVSGTATRLGPIGA